MRPSAIRSLAQSASTLSQRRLVRIQLLTNVPGIGKAGEVCLVQPGRMRNLLLPTGQAIYQPLPTPTSRSRDEKTQSQVEAQLAQAVEQVHKQEARVQLSKELGAVQQLSLRRNLERVSTVTFQRSTTVPSATTEPDQLPEPPLTIHGSLSSHTIVEHLRTEHGTFDLETEFVAWGEVAPTNKLTTQQISTACDFSIRRAPDNKEADALDSSGRIKKTGRYILRADIHATGVEIDIPVVVVPTLSGPTASTSSAASTASVASSSTTATMSAPSGARAFSTSAASRASAPTGMETSMRSKIESAFAPAEVNIRNDSSKHAHHAAMAAQGGGNGETHFFVEIISDAFEGMTQIKRHRAVNALMADEFERGLHALSLRTKTRKEVEKANTQTATARNDVEDGSNCPNDSTASTQPETEHLPSPIDNPSSYWTAPESSLYPTSPRQLPPSDAEALEAHLRQSRKFFRRVTKNENAPPAQWQRIANILGGVAGAGAAFYLVAMADFGDKEHCFTPVRRALFGDEKGWKPLQIDGAALPRTRA